MTPTKTLWKKTKQEYNNYFKNNNFFKDFIGNGAKKVTDLAMRQLYSFSTTSFEDRVNPYKFELNPIGGIITKIDEYTEILNLVLDDREKSMHVTVDGEDAKGIEEAIINHCLENLKGIDTYNKEKFTNGEGQDLLYCMHEQHYWLVKHWEHNAGNLESELDAKWMNSDCLLYTSPSPRD